MSSDDAVEKLAREAASGNDEAYKFLRTIIETLHTWDDLIDKDKKIEDAQVHKAFLSALISLPSNQFYNRNRYLLEPALFMATINWRAATNRERVQPSEWTFIIRSSYVDLVVLTKMLTSNYEEAIKFAETVHDITHSEQFGGYLNAVADERKAREG